MSNSINYLMMMIMMLSSSLLWLMILTKNIHPMLLTMNLIMFTVLMIMIMSILTPSFFYSFITFIMMIGGIMIMFGYFTSTIGEISNTPLKNKTYKYILITMLNFPMLTLMILNKFNNNYNFMKMNKINESFSMYNMPNNIFEEQNLSLMENTITILFMILLIVLKMISPQNTAMKKKK